MKQINSKPQPDQAAAFLFPGELNQISRKRGVQFQKIVRARRGLGPDNATNFCINEGLIVNCQVVGLKFLRLVF